MDSVKLGPTLLFIGESRFSDLVDKGVVSDLRYQFDADGLFQRIIYVSRYPVSHREEMAAQNAGVELASIANYGARPWLILRSAADLVQLIRHYRPMAIRSGMPYSASMLAIIIGRTMRVPTVVSIGGNHRLSNDMLGTYPLRWRALSNLVEMLVYCLADLVLAPSMYAADYVRSVTPKWTSPRIAVIPWVTRRTPSGLGAATSFPKTRAGATTIAIVGFLNEYKLTDVMFDAVDMAISEDAHSFEFYFCGSGPLLGPGISRFRNADNVHFLGWQPSERVYDLLEAADVVLVPMSGYVLLEAAQLGKAVVAADIEWHSEIITDRETGILVKNPHDPSEWFTAMSTFRSTPGLARATGSRLKGLFQRCFAGDVCAARQRELYTHLISRVGSKGTA